MWKGCLSALATAWFASHSAMAQDVAPAPAPCQTDPAYRAFDFWIGDWEVFDEGGAKVGDNLITAEEEGCLLVEQWTAISGPTGQSYNFYDPVERHWRQVWVSAGEVIDYVGNLSDDGVMELEGHITTRAPEGERVPFRGAWQPLPGGALRQSFHKYDETTGDWSTWFVGTYQPKQSHID